MNKISNYFKIHPYRLSKSNETETRILISLMEKRFATGFDNYWHQFGYEIAGPVCYAFTKWVSVQINKHPTITSVAFVARDGWLLKKIYEMLPSSPCKTAYVYASRLLEEAFKDETDSDYKRYFNSLDLGNDGIAIVDTVTTGFSSYKLISRFADAPILGFYWAALLGVHSGEYACESFQTGTNTIRCWNLMEFIMTSPEPPIIGLKNLSPVYTTPSPYELKREEHFTQMEKGVLEFVDDILSTDQTVSFSNRTITQWVNDFLKHPSSADITAFDNVVFSESADHSDIIYLDPFGIKTTKLNYRRLRDRIWMISMQHPALYRIVHAGNSIQKRIRRKFYSIGKKRFDGTNTKALVQDLSTYDVVSFDIFDTLILRSCKAPSDVFDIIEKKYGFTDFKAKRIKAEERARLQSTNKNHEINLYDIYNQLPFDGLIHKDLYQYEVDTEFDVCYANPIFLELYYKLLQNNCIIIATSDMYIPGNILQKLLHKCGYDKISNVFVSCDYGFGKGHGELQKAIQAKLGADLKYVHIGDNLLSDVQGSIAAGWDAILYKQ